jgi:Uma2 family endonuclease
MLRKDDIGRPGMELVKPLPGTLTDPLYPSVDPENVGESGFQLISRTWLWEALQDYFARKGNVFVASDLFWYWERGNPSASVSPDVMVVKNVGTHTRKSFRQWEENARPCVVFEIASEKTWREDVGEKRAQYEQLAVPEYFLFDPEGEYWHPFLQGYRFRRGKYTAIPRAKDGSLESKELGLRLSAEGVMIRLRDARSGRRVLTREEVARQSNVRARRAQRSAKSLEAEVARLRKQLEKRPPGSSET